MKNQCFCIHKKTNQQKAGFTLIELIVVMAVLSIVTLAIITVMQYSMRTFNQANLRAYQQAEARIALEQVRREVRYAKTVVVSNMIPTILPTADRYGYCYYNTANHLLYLHTMNGQTITFFQGLPSSLTYSIHFEPMAAVEGTTSDSIFCDWKIGNYAISTNIFIQNMQYWVGSSVSATYTTGPGIYIEFNDQ